MILEQRFIFFQVTTIREIYKSGEEPTVFVKSKTIHYLECIRFIKVRGGIQELVRDEMGVMMNQACGTR